MKFDVLKGMMDKTLSRSSEGNMELGEGGDIEDVDTSADDFEGIESQLSTSMTTMEMEAN
jgi:hypothetical protein